MAQIVLCLEENSNIADLIGIYLKMINVKHEIVPRNSENKDESVFRIYVTKFGWCYGNPPSANAFFYISEDLAGEICRYAKTKDLTLRELKTEMSQIIGGSHLSGILDSLRYKK